MRLNFAAWVLLAVCGVANVQQAGTQQAWTVHPEWVRAHEEFLASDVLAGRGSATQDEEIAATYVGSRFLAYGLQTAPGMTSYFQSAEVTSPLLNGHATLSAGAVVLREGEEFQILFSPGRGASAPLAHVANQGVEKASVARGSAILLTDVPSGTAARRFGAVRRLSPALVLVEQDASTAGMMTMYGGRTRLPIQLTGMERPTVGSTSVALTPLAMARLKGLEDGVTVSLNVIEVPRAQPRRTFNAVGYLPGSDSTSGTILLTSHLDHLGVGKPVDGDAIFNGADDDAAGTTAVLELAHALAAGPKLRRGVLFVCYGSEEVGGLGSTYFGEHPPVPLTSLVANLEFEMIGNQDPKMGKGVLLLTGWERSNLGPALKEHGASLGPDPYPEEHFFERSDNYSLALKGVVAHTAAGWGTPPTYHQPSDDLAHLDLAFMTSAIQSLVEPMRWLAMSDFKPEWNKGGRPERDAANGRTILR